MGRHVARAIVYHLDKGLFATQVLNSVRGEKALRTFPVAVRNGKVEVTA